MDKILLFDGLLSEIEYINAVSIINKKKWSYGQSSFDSNGITETTPFYHLNLMDEMFFAENITKKIEEITNKKYRLNRLYANGQSFGQNGSYHIDDYNENAFTFCLYITDMNDEIAKKADGYLHIKVPDEKKIISIEPLKNRGVLFPSNFYHKGCAFNRYFNNLRLCVAWKLIEIKKT